VKDGRPLADITVGIIQTGRDATTFLGERTAVTNAEGRFVLANVMPNDLTAFYSKMADGGAQGALPLRYVETEDHGKVVELGDLPLRPAARLTGRVILPGGGRVPADSRLVVFRDIAFDQLTVPIAEDGTFTAPGLPNEALTISLGVPGYRVSSKNARVNARGVVQLAPLAEDRELTLLLEPAPTTGR
jgi:hypothetical protein